MLNKDVRLKIKGVQRDLGQEDINEIDTKGEYFCRGKKHYLFYKEYQEDGQVLQNRLIVEPGYAELKKTGNGTSLLRFREGGSENCPYQSAMGQMELVSDTRRIKILPKDEGLKIMLFYSLYLHGQKMSDYELTITAHNLS